MATQPRRLQQLPEAEALRLLGSAIYGRIIFTAGGLPTVRPVTHIVDRGGIVVRTHFEFAALENAGPTVVAYEADMIDPDERTAWSVMVTGIAHLVEDAEQIGRYETMLPEPWMTDLPRHVIEIEPEVITGYAVVKD
jgi:Pyridoxamine 5'-phosphate oxidase